MSDETDASRAVPLVVPGGQAGAARLRAVSRRDAEALVQACQARTCVFGDQPNRR
jgi:hypothetical protein